MPKFYLDYLTNEDSYIAPQMEDVFQGVIAQIPFNADELKAKLLDDTDYAWTVHCNLVMGAIDAGCDKKRSAMAATEFLNEKFNVDVSRSLLWWNTYEYVEPPPVIRRSWADIVKAEEAESDRPSH